MSLATSPHDNNDNDLNSSNSNETTLTLHHHHQKTPIQHELKQKKEHVDMINAIWIPKAVNADLLRPQALPSPRVGHTLVCYGNHVFLYGGASTEDGFYGDIFQLELSNTNNNNSSLYLFVCLLYIKLVLLF